MHDMVFGVASFLSRVAFEGARCYYYARAQAKKVRAMHELAKARQKDVGVAQVAGKRDASGSPNAPTQDTRK